MKLLIMQLYVGACVERRYLTMDAFSYFSIPAFSRHVTVRLNFPLAYEYRKYVENIIQ
jgi:hypothetical protein